jgi:hypothetical protein
MTMKSHRPKVTVRFKYNIDTGDIEEFIVDDNQPGASEEHHDKIAAIVAKMISCQADIQDAGHIRHTRDQGMVMHSSSTKESKQKGILGEHA